MKEIYDKLVKDGDIFLTFSNLYFRWEDECQYEDFNDYVKAMKNVVEKCIGEIVLIKGTQNPFGIMFLKDGIGIGLRLKIEGDYGKMICGPLKHAA